VEDQPVSGFDQVTGGIARAFDIMTEYLVLRCARNILVENDDSVVTADFELKASIVGPVGQEQEPVDDRIVDPA
jgi:hypothetical protein